MSARVDDYTDPPLTSFNANLVFDSIVSDVRTPAPEIRLDVLRTHIGTAAVGCGWAARFEKLNGVYNSWIDAANATITQVAS